MTSASTRVSQRGRWLPARGVPGGSCRLFCYPYAGGTPQIYSRWGDHMPAGVALVPIHPPGRAARLSDPPIARLDELVDELVRELAPYTDQPYALLGHSMGSIVMYETAHALRDAGCPSPDLLVVGGMVAPHLPIRGRAISHLPEAEFRIELERLGGTPPAVLESDAVMALVGPALRADLGIVESYTWAERLALAMPIVVLGGTSDRTTDEAKLAAWAELTTGRCEVRMMPGDHFFIHQPPRLLLRTVSRVAGWPACP